MYKIAYIDDEDDVIRQFQANMMDDFEVIEIPLKEELNQVVDDLLESDVQAVVIDYNLNSSQPTIHYNGVTLLRHLQNTIKDFPCYILTSHEPAAEGTLFDPDLIRDKQFVTKNREFFVHKLKAKIENYEKQIDLYKDELTFLMERYPNLNSKDEERLIELDDILEKNSNGYVSLPSEVKKLSSDARLDRLIQLSETLIEELKAGSDTDDNV